MNYNTVLKHGSEILAIIEGGLDGNTKKVRAYAELLVSKLPDDDHMKTLPDDDHMKTAIKRRLDGSYKNDPVIVGKKPAFMQLGKILDLKKCVWEKDHWTHPDFKKDQLYIVCYQILDEDIWMLGTFFFADVHYFFRENAGGLRYHFGPFHDHETPIQEGWKHIQEVVVK